MSDLYPSHCKLLGALTLTAVKHLGDDTIVIDEDNNLYPGWRMACVGMVALVEKRLTIDRPSGVDCYQIEERSASGAFKLDPARLVYSLRWRHKAQPPDFDLMLLDEP